jgi:hypothetical protein
MKDELLQIKSAAGQEHIGGKKNNRGLSFVF